MRGMGIAAIYRKPKTSTPGTGSAHRIFNTDQGVQFTDKDFTRVLQAKGGCTNMDGKGRWVDSVFVERVWRYGNS
jgi:hypothetical protein